MKIYSDRITSYTHTGRLNGELINILELDYINSPDALNEQQIIFFKFFTLQFKIWEVWMIYGRAMPPSFTGLGWGTAPLPPPVYALAIYLL